MTTGLLLWGENDASQRLAAQGKGKGLRVVPFVQPWGECLRANGFERALIVGPGVNVPWHLVEPGFRFLEQWEAAAPLVERDLAEDLGKAAERRQTAALVRDLRVPVYACELLFVRDCEGGRGLLEAWGEEVGDWKSEVGGSRRLGFLRALYRVKPLFLALPRSWLREAAAPQVATRRVAAQRSAMVHVEVAPGRYVCCLPEEVEMYRARFARMRAGRRT